MKISLDIWDLSGAPQPRVIREAYYGGASLILFVFDLNDDKSFESLDKWLTSITETRDLNEIHKICVIGSKADLGIVVTHRAILELSKKWQRKWGEEVTVFYSSAKEDWFQTSLDGEKKSLSEFLAIISRDLAQARISETELLLCKVVLVGDRGVGKSVLTMKFLGRKFSTYYSPTVGADFLTYSSILKLEESPKFDSETKEIVR